MAAGRPPPHATLHDLASSGGKETGGKSRVYSTVWGEITQGRSTELAVAVVALVRKIKTYGTDLKAVREGKTRLTEYFRNNSAENATQTLLPPSIVARCSEVSFA